MNLYDSVTIQKEEGVAFHGYPIITLKLKLI